MKSPDGNIIDLEKWRKNKPPTSKPHISPVVRQPAIIGTKLVEDWQENQRITVKKEQNRPDGLMVDAVKKSRKQAKVKRENFEANDRKMREELAKPASMWDERVTHPVAEPRTEWFASGLKL